MKKRIKRPQKWFDNIFKPMADIDIYKLNFDREIGYSIHFLNNRNLLVYKIEIPDHEKIAAIEKFLNIKDFQLIRKNKKKKKVYSDIYLEFNKKFKLPYSYLKEIYNTEFMKHFYTENEISSFIERWSE